MREVLGEDGFKKIYFQQDGAPAHRSKSSIQYLRSVFGGNLMSSNGGEGTTPWPASSPDLSAMDFYFWPKISNKVYGGDTVPTDLNSLKSELQTAFEDYDPAENTRAVTRGFLNRIDKCLEHDGGHFENKKLKKTSIENQDALFIPAYSFIHVLNKSTGTTQLVIGPENFILKEDLEIILKSPFINIPRHHFALISFEGIAEERYSNEPFPLFPGEKLVRYGKCSVEDELPIPDPEDLPSSCLPPITLSSSPSSSVKLKFVADGEDVIEDLKDREIRNCKENLVILMDMKSMADKLVGKFDQLHEIIDQEIGAIRQMAGEASKTLPSPRKSRVSLIQSHLGDQVN